MALCCPNFPGRFWMVVVCRKKKKTKQKIKFMQNSSGKRIEASQGDLNEVIKATGTLDAHILVMS